MARRDKRLKKRSEREERTKERRAEYERRQRNKKLLNYSLIGVGLIVVAYFIYSSVAPEGPGEYDDLARCLTQNGVVMYGTDWCPHCQEQKRMFGSSFRYVTYVNCDLNNQACELAGVQGYPTWVFPTSGIASGVQDLESLAARAECTDGSQA